jgi:hypothetical protein
MACERKRFIDLPLHESGQSPRLRMHAKLHAADASTQLNYANGTEAPILSATMVGTMVPRAISRY